MTTISDVALTAGVSEATVSRVLNHPEIVGADKRQRVLQAIEELRFEPSYWARTLRAKAFGAIALLVGDVSQPYHGMVAKAVENAADANGYTVMLGDLNHREDRLLDFLQELPQRGVDGILLATADEVRGTQIRKAIAEVQKSGIPLVTTSESIARLSVPSVLTDLRQIGRDAATHLLERDRNSLLVLAGSASSWHSQSLNKGVSEAFEPFADRKPDVTVANGRYGYEAARRVVGRILEQGRRPSGIVAANVPMAIGAQRAMSDQGMSLPRDIAMVVCEKVPVTEFLTPTLTTIGVETDTLGTRAFQLLLDLMAGNVAHEQSVIPHQLTIGESSGA